MFEQLKHNRKSKEWDEYFLRYIPEQEKEKKERKRNKPKKTKKAKPKKKTKTLKNRLVNLFIS